MANLVTELKKMVKEALVEAGRLASVPPRYRTPEYMAAQKAADRLEWLLANEVCAAIEAAPTPVIRDALRSKGRRARAQAIRALLKDLRIPAVSVTAPSYSMAQSIDIALPRVSHEHCGTEYRDCPRCQRRYVARERLEKLILAAYPDLNDRSDLMTDHFDYCLSIN